MEKRSQRRFSTEEKYKILQEGEYGNMSINEVCRRHGVTTAAYYAWRKQAQAAMKDGLANKRKKNEREQHLEEEIKRLKNTIVEITQENVELKKSISNKRTKPFYCRGEEEHFGLYHLYQPAQWAENQLDPVTSGSQH